MKIIRGILIALVVLAVLATAGYLYLYNHGLSGKALEVDPPVDGQIKVACVGDSITYGHGIQKWEENNYPVRLQALLGDDYHVRSFGVSGRAVQDNSDQPYTALEAYTQSKEYDADIVVFMMGTNDSKPENWHGSATFEAALCSLLDSYGDAQIILCTPATAFFLKGETTGITSFDIQPQVVTEIAAIVQKVAEQRNYPLVDIYRLTAENQQWFASDGVHPNNDGAAAIAQAVCQTITDLRQELVH